MFDLILIILLIILITVISKKYRKFDKEFAERREKFVEYLDEIRDLETLEKIGEINWFGKRERVYPRYSQIVNWIEKKYEETNDEHFRNFLEDYRMLVGKFSIMIPIIIISFFVIIYLIKKSFS